MGIPLRVLIVEDSEDDTYLLVHELQHGGYDPTYQRVETEQALHTALAQQPWDVVLSDYVMPQLDGLTALRVVQASGLDLPFIIVSGCIGEETAVAAMRAGAHDYLLKDRLSRLGSAVSRELSETQERRARREAEAALRASLEEKETLLREIHHRVKNNLAVVCSLFYLESTYAQDERVVVLLQEAQDRVRTMALVHESLYRSENLAAVNFGDYTRSLLESLFRSYGSLSQRVHLRTDLEGVLLTVETAIPCGLILNELVTNCLKHAFPAAQTGEICVRLRRQEDGRCLLSVTDTGIGVPPDLNTQKGLSLGLRILRSLTGQLEGKLEIYPTNPGTEARLSFPLPSPSKQSTSDGNREHPHCRRRGPDC